MLEEPVSAKQIRVRLHWGNSAEELEEDVNSHLEAYPSHDIYGMEYKMTTVPRSDGKLCEKHFMAVIFHP
ncbi:hypothetical protein ACFLYI_02650 [Chloroflexota bacterium]